MQEANEMSGFGNIQESSYLSLIWTALHNGTLKFDLQGGLSATLKDEPHHLPGFRKLIAGIQFSRQFILSYQLVLLCLLLSFASFHWISRLRSWLRVRLVGRARQDCEIKNGRSSTLHANSTTFESLVKIDERSPLLHTDCQKRTLLSNITCRTRAFLVYQPSPIPIIHKTLPSNGCTLLILAFLALQAFYTLYNVHLSVPMLFVFADRAGLVFVANLPLLYLFAAKNQPIKLLTGYSYESLNIFHRRLGEIMCLLALLHSLGMLGVWYTILRPAGSTLTRFLLSKIILLGKSFSRISSLIENYKIYQKKFRQTCLALSPAFEFSVCPSLGTLTPNILQGCWLLRPMWQYILLLWAAFDSYGTNSF